MRRFVYSEIVDDVYDDDVLIENLEDLEDGKEYAILDSLSLELYGTLEKGEDPYEVIAEKSNYCSSREYS